MIRLADFVVPEAILPDLRATTKEEAFHEMVDALRAAGCIAGPDAEDVVQAVLRREQLGTTAWIGAAMPEARHPAVARMVGTIALSRGGVEFDAIDGGPVHILFLVVSPPSRPREFLQAEEIIILGGRQAHGNRPVFASRTVNAGRFPISASGSTHPE